MKNYHFILAGGMLLLNACSQPASTADTGNAVKKDSFDIVSVKAAIVANNKIFCDAMIKGDSNAAAALYATSAKMFPANSPVIDNAEAMKSFLAMPYKVGIREFNLETVDVFGTADNVIEEGKYTLGDGKGKVFDHGKYIVVWKNENGNWKLYRDIFNTDVPMETPKKAAKKSGSKM